MEIKAQALYSEMQAMAAQSRAELAPIPNPQINPTRANFADMLQSAVDGVNSMQHNARNLTNRFEMGDASLSLVDVMVAREKSSIAFEATLQTRNKVLEAYKQIMQMPV